MKVYLKIKIKSLAEEAKIIRFEEKRWPGRSDEYQGLHFHRTYDVRNEARAAQLAYGYLRGRKYRQLEASCYTAPNRTRIRELIIKYGIAKDKAAVDLALKQWLDEPLPLERAA